MEYYSELPVKNKNGKWDILILDQRGKVTRTVEFETEELAKDAIRDNKSKQQKPNMSEEKKETTFLEGMLGDMNSVGLPMNDLPDPMEIEKKRGEIQEAFKVNDDQATEEAKNLLESVAKLYLDAKLLSEDGYVKFKIQTQTKGLSSLIFQIEIAKKAIYKLSEEIQLGNAAPRMFEVLTGMQRIALDIAKFQADYLDKMEEDMKKIRDDMSGAESVTTAGVKVTDADGNTKEMIITTNSRKNLLRELDDMLGTKLLDVNPIPKSRNSKLHDDDENVVDVEYTEYADEQNDHSADRDENLGLGTFEEGK